MKRISIFLSILSALIFISGAYVRSMWTPAPIPDVLPAPVLDEIAREGSVLPSPIDPSPSPALLSTSSLGTIPIAITFPPLETVCDYAVIALWRNNLLKPDGTLRVTHLNKARSCGTKVVVRLEGKTSDIAGVDGKGMDLSKFEDRINDFAGLLEPYVADGTILAHFTIDEPHDCKNDWGGTCPQARDVDEAGRISKTYWPGLQTMVNTSPAYAGGYTWAYTDIINFQYAFHKGALDSFLSTGVDVLSRGRIPSISWSIQAAQGGCSSFGNCAMTPDQVRSVGTSMCQTGQGRFVSFFSYRDDLMTDEMRGAIDAIRLACRDSR
ncbi:MAG: hypothetical protein Q7S76_03965 [bacterium]|nr:hypothetical protein [bacterium]